jgi:hypothetical protein
VGVTIDIMFGPGPRGAGRFALEEALEDFIGGTGELVGGGGGAAGSELSFELAAGEDAEAWVTRLCEFLRAAGVRHGTWLAVFPEGWEPHEPWRRVEVYGEQSQAEPGAADERKVSSPVFVMTGFLVSHWFGVTPQTVSKWRKVLGVGLTNDGTHRLRSDYCAEPWAVRARNKAHAKARDPERRRKIAEARTGKPRPPHVIETIRRAHVGRKASAETRAKMSAAHRRRHRLRRLAAGSG